MDIPSVMPQAGFDERLGPGSLSRSNGRAARRLGQRHLVAQAACWPFGRAAAKIRSSTKPSTASLSSTCAVAPRPSSAASGLASRLSLGPARLAQFARRSASAARVARSARSVVPTTPADQRQQHQAAATTGPRFRRTNFRSR